MVNALVGFDTLEVLVLVTFRVVACLCLVVRFSVVGVFVVVGVVVVVAYNVVVTSISSQMKVHSHNHDKKRWIPN